MKKRVVIIGLDGLPKNLLDLLVKRGHFKNIKKILKEGIYRDLESTIPPVTAPAWISFATGTTPETHQCYDWVYPKETINNFKPIDSRDIKLPTFYEILNKKGKRCVLINMPGTYPPKIKETVITGLLTKGNNCFFPKSLKKELKSAKEYMIVPENVIDRKSKRYIESVRKVERKKFALAQELFKKKDWDFFFILFGASDWIQHGNYADMVEKKPRNSLVWKAYEDLDQYVGWFKNSLRTGDSLIVMSDHGFTDFEKVFFFNTWLKDKKLLTYGSEKKAVEWSKLSKTKKRKLFLFQDFILNFLGNFPKLYSLMKRIYFKIGPFLPFVKKDYLKLKKNMLTELRRIKMNKKKLFTKIVEIKEEKTKTGRILPDAVFYSHDFNIKGIQGPLWVNLKTQGHSQTGIFIGFGRGFKSRKIKKKLSIIDLAPTILSLLEVKVPNYMEEEAVK